MKLSPANLLGRLRGLLGKPLATVETDPQLWLNALYAMPNPDPILRRMGRAEDVYASILRDTHVIGDVRSSRGNFRSYSYRLLVGNEGDPASVNAHALCEEWLARRKPAGDAGTGLQPDWLEVMWQMNSATLYGYRVHELVWGLDGGKYLPAQVLDRPNRRIQFNAAGEALLISRGTGLQGVPVDPQYFVISRHMADAVNPYGISLLSSCFWPWTFKTGGWRVFVKYCERHGLPWPVARYPMGTPDEEVDKLEDAIANMLEAAYAVVPEGNGVELLVPNRSGSGDLPQQQLIDQCNREISKALTGQAMVAELSRVGARAASETAADRQANINDSDRDIPTAGMNQVFQWITLFNFGAGVAPPTLEFYQHENAGKDRAETYQIAADMGARPSKSALLEELGIPQAEDDDDALLPSAKAAPLAADQPGQPGTPPRKSQPAIEPATIDRLDLSGLAGFEFARAAGMTEDEAAELATAAADQAIEDHMIAPVVTMLERFEAEGKTLADFRAAFEDLVGQIDDEALREVLDRALTYSIQRGAATRAA